MGFSQPFKADPSGGFLIQVTVKKRVSQRLLEQLFYGQDEWRAYPRGIGGGSVFQMAARPFVCSAGR